MIVYSYERLNHFHNTFFLVIIILIYCEDNEAHREIRSNDDDASQQNYCIRMQSLALYAMSTDAIRWGRIKLFCIEYFNCEGRTSLWGGLSCKHRTRWHCEFYERWNFSIHAQSTIVFRDRCVFRNK